METTLFCVLEEFFLKHKKLIPFILLDILKNKKACKPEKLKIFNLENETTEYTEEEEDFEIEQESFSCAYEVLQESKIIVQYNNQDFIQMYQEPIYFEKVTSFVGRPRGRGRGRGGSSSRGRGGKKKVETSSEKKTKKKDSNSSNDDSDFVEGDDEDPDEKPKKRGRPPKKQSKNDHSEEEEEEEEEESEEELPEKKEVEKPTRKIIRRKAETKEETNEDSKLKYFQFICENLVEWKEEKLGAKKKMLGKHFEQTKEISKPVIIEKIEEEKVEPVQIAPPLKIITSQQNQLKPQILSPIDTEGSPNTYKIPKKKTIESPITPIPQEVLIPIFDPVPPELPIPHDILPKEVLIRWYKQYYGNLPIYKESFSHEGVFSSVTLPHLGISVSHQLPSKNLEIAENQSSLRAIEHLWKIKKQKELKIEESKLVNTQRMEWRPQPQEKFNRPQWNPQHPPPPFEKRFN